MKKSVLLKKESLKLLPFYLFFVILTVAVSNNSFFWDKDIIISKTAFWFYENNFSFQLPNSIDTGYTPILSLILALLWKIFGIKLQIGHYLMLPFSLGLIYQLYIFLKNLLSTEKYVFPALILITIDTTLLSQVIVVSSDLVLAFFFFLSVNSILGNKRYILYFSLLGLSLVHFRGVISCFVILILDYYIHRKEYKGNYFKSLLNIIPQYLPSVLIYAGYLLYHYKTTGWILKHDDSPWASCFEVVSIQGFIRNILIIFWRLIDFGRLIFWIAGFYMMIMFIKKKFRYDDKIQLLILLISIAFIVNLPSMLMFNIMAGHRYFIVIYILITATVAYLLFEKTRNKRLIRIFYAIIIIVMISGNFWIYPDKIAKGWDATIAHIPYYKLRKKMIHYIENKGISFNDIGSEVPNTAMIKYIDLSDDNRQFPLKNFDTHKYIFYSNIYNMFTDEEIDELKNNWLVEKEYRFLQVYVILYKNPVY
ncbi:MAG: hypothetical protein JSV22_12215 [Bacteroidales bacterium]|nr:MAG: hypothetical protein JSV22_12215 [Bacteroidales bacterium]